MNLIEYLSKYGGRLLEYNVESPYSTPFVLGRYEAISLNLSPAIARVVLQVPVHSMEEFRLAAGHGPYLTPPSTHQTVDVNTKELQQRNKDLELKIKNLEGRLTDLLGVVQR